MTVRFLNADSSDQHCYRVYTLWIKDADNAADPYVQFTNGAHNFLKNYDTSNTAASGDTTFKVGSTDQTFLGGVQTKNYTVKMRIQILTSDQGQAQVERTMTLRVDSLCTKVSISNTTKSYEYFIRTTQ